MGTGKRREPAQIARDRLRIADMYLRGRLQADIAEEVGLSEATVSRDLKVLHADWLRSANVDYSEAKAGELAKIDALEREYWQAWRRSQEDAETIRKKATDVSGTERKELIKTAKGQAGDPRFLNGVQWCIERRCKILGIDAAAKLDVTTKGERLGSISDDQRLAAGAAYLDAIRARSIPADNEPEGAMDTADEGTD